MSKIYKIHPAIGFARVGRSEEGFFLAGESPDAPPFELNQNGVDSAFRGYKDAAHIIRRQGARFHVFEYDKDDVTKKETLSREITAADATVEWKVQIAAAKAAGREMRTKPFTDGVRTLFPGSNFRNSPPAGFTRNDLRAAVELTASGVNFALPAAAAPKGKFLGKDIYLGEARTDASGRLVFLAGRGDAWTWTGAKILEFLNNPGWHDDIGDGPVEASLTFPDGSKFTALGAWVFATPPDFAPDTTPITTLYDIAQQAANASIPDPLTYPQDIAPILQRAAGLFYVNEAVSEWQILRDHLASTPSLDDNSPEKAVIRNQVKNDLFNAQAAMNSFRLTARQRTIMERWAAGSFQSAPDPARFLSDAEKIDKASLDRCVGGGYFPGIEAGTTLRQPTIYSEFARLVRGTFTDMDGSVVTLEPGLLSSRMACPWQADFMECETNWWPSQRPDIVGRNPNDSSLGDWVRGLVVGPIDSHESHMKMVDHFAQLGVVVRNGSHFEEIGRDPALDTGV